MHDNVTKNDGGSLETAIMQTLENSGAGMVDNLRSSIKIENTHITKMIPVEQWRLEVAWRFILSDERTEDHVVTKCNQEVDL